MEEDVFCESSFSTYGSYVSEHAVTWNACRETIQQSIRAVFVHVIEAEAILTSGRGWRSKKWCKRHEGEGRVISYSIAAVATRQRWVWRTRGAYACAMPSRRNLAQGTRTVGDRLCWVGGMPRLRFSGTLRALCGRERAGHHQAKRFVRGVRSGGGSSEGLGCQEGGFFGWCLVSSLCLSSPLRNRPRCVPRGRSSTSPQRGTSGSGQLEQPTVSK